MLDQRDKLLEFYAPIEIKTDVNVTVDYSQMSLEELTTFYNQKLNEPVKIMKQIIESNFEEL